jgi:hypothetical protein
VPITKKRKSFYPVDWELRSRFVRFYRARNKCEWCGSENYKPHPITGSKVILTTAHINDDLERPHQLLNLAGLCQRCHNRYDAKDRVKRRLLKSRDSEQINFLKEMSTKTN